MADNLSFIQLTAADPGGMTTAVTDSDQ